MDIDERIRVRPSRWHIVAIRQKLAGLSLASVRGIGLHCAPTIRYGTLHAPARFLWGKVSLASTSHKERLGHLDRVALWSEMAEHQRRLASSL